MAIIVSESTTLHEAIKEMRHQGARLIFVVDSKESLVGVISQGDLLKATSYAVTVKSIMEMNPVFLFEEKQGDALVVMKKYRFSEIPILSKDYRIIDILAIWDLC